MACFGVLLLPMDVANRNSAFQDALRSNGVWAGESLPMTGIWEVVLMSIVVMVLGIIPFAIFYYEESGEGCAAALKCDRRCRRTDRVSLVRPAERCV